MRQLTGHPAMTRSSPNSQLLESVQLTEPVPAYHPRGIADAIRVYSGHVSPKKVCRGTKVGMTATIPID